MAKFASPAMAKEIKRIYGNSAKVVKINIQHEEAIRKYVMEIERAHKKAAKSKVTFR